MKTLPKLAMLFPLVAACGGATRINANAVETNADAVETECSLTLSANATAAEMREAISAVLDGKTDPCGGAAGELKIGTVALERVDHASPGSGGKFTLVFLVAGGYRIR